MSFQTFLPVIFLALCQSCLVESHMELELVEVLFRHGERTPLEEDYAALRYPELSVYEPFGLGQLTDNGKRQAYKVGRMLRNRYNGFLNETYNPEDIFAQSAELDRIQNSLQLVLAGLYSSDADPKLIWDPIPYRCAPEKLDVLFRQYNSTKYVQLLDDVLASPVVVEKFKAYSELRDFLKDKEGVKINNWAGINFLFNTLLINKRLNVSLPEWYSDDLISRLREFSIFYADCLCFTPELRRATAGPLVKTLLERMNLNSTTRNPRKMYLYSGSDINVAVVARAFNANGFRYVDFSSTLILEKLRDSDGQLYVRLLEWDAIDEKITSLRMNECAELCPVDDFLKICRDVIPSEEEMNYLLDDFQGQNILDLYIKDPLVDEK